MPPIITQRVNIRNARNATLEVLHIMKRAEERANMLTGGEP
jgi:hypothetical protein